MRYLVEYSVRLKAEIEVADGDDLMDTIRDIDIPEGGNNDSQYVESSFEVVSVKRKSEEA